MLLPSALTFTQQKNTHTQKNAALVHILSHLNFSMMSPSSSDQGLTVLTTLFVEPMAYPQRL